MKIVCAPDKYRGSLSAADAASAIAEGLGRAGATSTLMPMSDGGEGFLASFGGGNRSARVTGPLGETVQAAYRMSGQTAWIESAEAIGLALVDGAKGNDAVSASTYGLGELVLAAIEAGARTVMVGLGGSSTTDGGWGALRALHPFNRLRGVELVVGYDVDCRFAEAAEQFAPQKGATSAETKLLTKRLERLVQVYLDDHGVDVSELVGAGAAGGLAGGLAAIGARLEPGFELVAEERSLYEEIEKARGVITGEGLLDQQSFAGKVVGGVFEMAQDIGIPALAIVGAISPDLTDADLERLAPGCRIVSLSDRFGLDTSMGNTGPLISDIAQEWASSLP